MMTETGVVPCPLCRDTGFIETEAGFTECECRRLSTMRHRLISEARIPRKFLQKSLVNFSPANPRLKSILSEAQAYVATFIVGPEDDGSGCRGLLLRGTEGVGKTHLAVSILKDLVERGHSGLFWNVPDLFLELRRVMSGDMGISSEAEIIDSLRRPDILVLDDLGAERTSDYTMDRLYTIINSRYSEDRATIITTNCNQQELADRVGRSSASRLREMCLDVSFPEGDWRRRNLS
jgi:DNA replication protein DnaC